MGANLSVLVIGSENDVWKCTDETGSIDLVALLGVLEQQAENDTNLGRLLVSDLLAATSEHEEEIQSKNRGKNVPMIHRRDDVTEKLVPVTPKGSQWHASHCFQNAEHTKSKRFLKRFRQRFRLPCGECWKLLEEVREHGQDFFERCQTQF
jgi:hypothetical protein